jgi:hypothetical protein
MKALRRRYGLSAGAPRAYAVGDAIVLPKGQRVGMGRRRRLFGAVTATQAITHRPDEDTLQSYMPPTWTMPGIGGGPS